jgi:quinol monooxygenase YgiN
MARTLVITHEVADYDAWHRVFTEHATVRKEHGCSSEELFRNPKHPNEVMNVMRFPGRENVEAFLADPSLQEAMGRAGVVGTPRIEFWESVQQVEL